MNDEAQKAKALLLDGELIKKEDILGVGTITNISMANNLYETNYKNTQFTRPGNPNTTLTIEIPGNYTSSVGISPYDEIMIIRRHRNESNV